ncbi:MAG: SPOR domain-containing protein [Candidatus Thiodiazotropha endolucinida]
MGLEERLKQRLLGGAVLVALVVIFVPMLIEEPVERRTDSDYTIPVKPALNKSVPEKRNQQPRATEPQPVPAIKKPEPQKMSKPEPTVTKEVKPPVSKPVKASGNASNRPSPTAWMIQVASLTNEKNADNLVKRLRKADLPAQMEKVRLNGKLHYRIRVGPEVDHRLAEQMLAKIKTAFKLNPKLMRYPESKE